MIKVSIAIDFSRTPGARFPEEGEFSGKEFREEILLPKLKEAIKTKDKLEVNLDGTAGMGTSFLEEAFGGLIREDKVKYDDIMNIIVFKSDDDPEYKDEILSYMQEANKNASNN
jgi:hypothetical protein